MNRKYGDGLKQLSIVSPELLWIIPKRCREISENTKFVYYLLCESMLKMNHVEKAESLFFKTRKSSEQQLITSFESIYSTISLLPSSFALENVTSKKLLLRTFQYSSLRFSDLFFRLNLINWINKSCKRKTAPIYGDWYTYTGLAIKDFHIDISSFMDSLAPIIIQSVIGLKEDDQKKFPGFPDILKGTKRSFRKNFPPELMTIIDSTNRWWPKIKTIRDILAHREHQKIIYSKPSDGIVFQVYGPGFSPKIIDKVFLCKQGHNIVNFDLYSAFIIVEILVFMEELARFLCKKLNLSLDTLTPSIRSEDYRLLLNSMDKLKNT